VAREQCGFGKEFPTVHGVVFNLGKLGEQKMGENGTILDFSFHRDQGGSHERPNTE
jgi:hypothetical protein